MNSQAIASPTRIRDQVRGEQQDDDEAGEDRRKHRRRDRPADQRHPAVEDVELAEPAVVLLAAAGEQHRLDLARAVDDPRQARGADVQEAPMPLSRNTGATASRTISATVLTEGSARSRTCALIRRRARTQRRCQRLALAARDLEQQQAVDDEARGQHPGEAGDQPARRPEHADHDGRDRQAGDQQQREQEIHPRRKDGPHPDRSVGLGGWQREDHAAQRGARR